MKQKLKNHYKAEYSIDVSNEDIDFIIKHDCKCSTCGKSIFEMWDFPELIVNDDELRCEDCYNEDYRATCPICENSYDIYGGESEYEVIVEGDEDYNFEYPGIYKNEQLIVPIKINEYKKIETGEHCTEVYSDKICSECEKKFTAKERYLTNDTTPCLLIERCRYDVFSDWSIERIKRARKALIHQRITCRGIIQTANTSTKWKKNMQSK